MGRSWSGERRKGKRKRKREGVGKRYFEACTTQPALIHHLILTNPQSSSSPFSLDAVIFYSKVY